MTKMRIELVGLFKKKKLAKSEDSLSPGWTGEVSVIKTDLDAVMGRTLDKYVQALRWVLIGDAAGKEGSAAAVKVGLKGKVTPGLVYAAYTHSLDAHSEHYEGVTGETSPEIPVDVIDESFSQILKRINMFLEQSLSQLKTSVTAAADQAVTRHNFKVLSSVHESAHDALPESGAEEAVAQADSDTAEAMTARSLGLEIKRATDAFESKWEGAARTDISLASATGTHQAMLEIYGAKNDSVKVAWIEMEDEKVCSFCKSASKRADGSHKLYDISDFEPSGYNYGRKKAEWKLTIPPAHPRCRCQLVYVPAGFTVDSTGGLVRK